MELIAGMKKDARAKKDKHLRRHWHKRGFDRNSPDLPHLVQVTADFLEKNCLQVEGIFRVSGQMIEVGKLKKTLDKGRSISQ
jgi:hypothetical protein